MLGKVRRHRAAAAGRGATIQVDWGVAVRSASIGPSWFLEQFIEDADIL